MSTLKKKEPDDHCNGRKRDGSGYCGQTAGWGTDHPGTGRCKWHGGASTGPKNGPGIYRTKMGPEYQQIYDRFREDDDLQSLDDEVALVKTLVYEAIERGGEGRPESVTGLVERLSRILKRKVEMEEGLNYYIHIEGLNVVVNQVVQIIERHVDDPETRAAIGEDLARIHLPRHR